MSQDFKVGDLVARKSYQYDVIFRIVDVKKNGHENLYILKGINYRLEADSPGYDLEILQDQEVKTLCTEKYGC